MTTGYSWYIRCADGPYQPTEEIFPTLEGLLYSMQDYNYPLDVCGVDLVEEDEGCVEVMEEILTPLKTYFEDEEWE